ncbi:RcnB family protein [Sphingobium sufflavum]|nr:RcnB family protein [Sphingobium sufflavum]
MALTALAAMTPAMAQENGGWRGRGMERQSGGNPGGGNPGIGASAPQRGWRDNGAQQPRPEMPRADGGARPMDRQWNGQRNTPWQAPDRPVAQAPSAQPPMARPPVTVATDRPDRGWNQNGRNQNDRTGGADWNRDTRPPNAGQPSADRPSAGWRNRDRDDVRNRPDLNLGPNRGDGRGADGRWGNDPRNNDRWNNGRDDRRPQPVFGNGGGTNGNWQNRNGWQNGGRLNASDRWRDQQRWSNDWRRDNRYDWSRYRQINRSAYRLPAYRPPSGWAYGYSRFSIGLFLGGPLFSNSYWIDDPYSYRLPPAYGTLRWVRYYDDALLVDIRDGYVVDVIHDFFW